MRPTEQQVLGYLQTRGTPIGDIVWDTPGDLWVDSGNYAVCGFRSTDDENVTTHYELRVKLNVIETENWYVRARLVVV